MDLNMALSLIIELIFICVGAGLCYSDLYYLQPQTELLMYRHRNKIVYKRLNAEGCTALGQMKQLSIPADTKVRLEMERRFYEELIQILIACRREAKQVSTTPPSLATQDPTTTIPPTTPTPVPTTSIPTSTTSSSTPTTSTLALTTTTLAQTPSTPAPTTSTLALTTTRPAQTMTATTRPSTTTAGSVTCSSGYFLNPVSSTCIRLVAVHTNWDVARANCEASGEHLAVFETVESVQWLYHFLRSKTGEDDRQPLWIGMRASNGTWRWQGKSNDIINADLWNKLYPDVPHGSSIDDCGCVASFLNGVGLFVCGCSATSPYHICERI